MELHFLRPLWFLVIIPIITLSYFSWRYQKQGGNWQKIIDPILLNYLFNKSDVKQNYLFITLLSLTWLIAMFILAGPVWKKSPQPLFRNDSAKIIALDLSPSMSAVDILPDRLTRAKYKVLDILRKYPEGETGMIVFSSEAYVVSPLTNDTNTIALMVPDLSRAIMPVAGSNISFALDKAISLLQQTPAKSGTIVLITDSEPSATDFNTAAKIHQEGYTISLLAVGMIDSSTPLAIKKLQQLAHAGGGRFTTFTATDKDIDFLLTPTLQNNSSAAKKTPNSSVQWIDEGRQFILLILLLIIVSFRRGGLMEGKQ